MLMAKTHTGEVLPVDDLLPPEIWHHILTNLPAKSILRCRSVCKTWYSLISSPRFITDHAAQTLNHSTSHRVLVQRGDFDTLLCKFSSHDESFVESHEHNELTAQFSRGIVESMGSCNGLVCLLKLDQHARTHSFLIWNPSIRKLVQLPNRTLSPDDNETLYLLGFGFDPNSGDYKVLRVGYFNEGPKFGVPVVSEIFDLRKGVWRAISHPRTPHFVKDPYKPDFCVYLHGSLNWIGNEDQYQPIYVIVSFNLSSEVYQEMRMPGDVELKDVQHLFCILANKGLLSVALLRKRLQGNDVQDYCTVWSMKEYGVTESWTKLFNIELPYALNHLGLVRIWENGEVVIERRESENALVVYNPQNRTSKALFSVSADEVDEVIFDVCFYKESLVLLSEPDFEVGYHLATALGISTNEQRKGKGMFMDANPNDTQLSLANLEKMYKDKNPLHTASSDLIITILAFLIAICISNLIFIIGQYL